MTKIPLHIAEKLLLLQDEAFLYLSTTPADKDSLLEEPEIN